MNPLHAQQVADITALVLDFTAPAPLLKTRIPDEEISAILKRRTGSDADGPIGDVMQAMGYRDWYTRLSHRDAMAARSDWRLLAPDGKFQRLKWFAGQVEKWAK